MHNAEEANLDKGMGSGGRGKNPHKENFSSHINGNNFKASRLQSNKKQQMVRKIIMK